LWQADVFDNLFIFIFRLKLGARMRGKGYLKSFQMLLVQSHFRPSHDYAHTKAETQGSNQRNKQQKQTQGM
jgi:hypothetical protein